MIVRTLKNRFTKALSEIYPSEEVQSFFSILSEKYLGLSRLELAVNSEMNLSEAVADKYSEAIVRLKKFEPIQYIIGETFFHNMRFKLNKHTLIPRPETEELADWIINDYRDSDALNSNPQTKTLIDIGTGSGCIAVSLAANITLSKVVAIDISKEALNVARHNADLNNVTIEFLKDDILTNPVYDKRFDVIVSNPPYVRELEKQTMQQNVLKHEPVIALFVSNEDPLLFYRAIVRFAQKHLKSHGFLYFEINEYLSKELITMLASEGFFHVVVKKDIYGKDRMIKCGTHEWSK